MGNWSAVKEDDEDGSDVMDVRQGSGVGQPVMVTLHIELDGGESSCYSGPFGLVR